MPACVAIDGTVYKRNQLVRMAYCIKYKGLAALLPITVSGEVLLCEALWRQTLVTRVAAGVRLLRAAPEPGQRVQCAAASSPTQRACGLLSCAAWARSWPSPSRLTDAAVAQTIHGLPGGGVLSGWRLALTGLGLLYATTAHYCPSAGRCHKTHQMTALVLVPVGNLYLCCPDCGTWRRISWLQSALALRATAELSHELITMSSRVSFGGGGRL